MVPGLRRLRAYYATIRFMLIIGGGIAFVLAALKADTLTGAMQNVGWFLLCATVLFIDPENPPNQTSDPFDLPEDLPALDDETP
jgi:hypothetical protein